MKDWAQELLENKALLQVTVGMVIVRMVRRDDGRYMAGMIKSQKAADKPFESFSDLDGQKVMNKFWEMVREEFALQNDDKEFVPSFVHIG